MKTSELATFLDLTDEQLEQIPLGLEDLNENTGNSGDTIYNYYFEVPESTPSEILNSKGWEIGETIEVPRDVVEGDDEYEED
ncbi:hypothetical protein [Rahnella aceris]|uniref:hypothetical protein n=1 Tax=Rahnella sp. (strain Y9602) TaxID=2703885 RepID=UPI001420A6E4|nr:hypothetical protein [Rahnella aceris]NIA89955.1 hypothetical protein [Rahnella aceris]